MKKYSNIVHAEFEVGIVVRTFRRVKAAIARRAAIRQLHALPDRMLRDIGIERSQIREMVTAQGTLSQLAVHSTQQSNAPADLRQAA